MITRGIVQGRKTDINMENRDLASKNWEKTLGIAFILRILYTITYLNRKN